MLIKVLFVLAAAAGIESASFSGDPLQGGYGGGGRLVGDDMFVTTRLGQLRGRVLSSRGGLQYYSFMGIPYAERAKRFAVSTPVQPWEDIKDAGRAGSVCPQRNLMTGEVIGDEDCLYLNVFVPAKERCEGVQNLPVLFHIHGGAFVMGSGDLYGPNYFMDECLIFVSINYRLGALGFLTTGDGMVPANIALKDQLLALKWTKDNIDSFRGDGNGITVMGFSAGACSVGHILTSPATKGLYRSAIAQSGSVLIPGCVFRGDPMKYIESQGRFLNCTSNTREELINCLKSVDVKDLIMSQELGHKWNNDQYPFGAVIEPKSSPYYTAEDQPYQTEDPYLKLLSGDFNKVPLLTGFMKDEGILLQAAQLFLNPQAISDLNNDWNRVAPITLYYDDLKLTEAETDDVSRQIRSYYFGNKSIGAETRQNLVDLNSDRYFVQESFISNELLAKQMPVYNYVFTFQGTFSYAALFQWPGLAVTHTDDTQYLFDSPGLVPEFPPGSPTLQMSQNVVKVWTSFVLNGKPTIYQQNVQWPALNPESGHRETMKLDIPAELLVDYLEDRTQFWKQLGLRELENRNKSQN